MNDSAAKQPFHPYFILSGEFDPDDITRQLEIEPSRVARIGDPGPPDAMEPRRGAVWVWQPLDDDSHDVGDQLAYMAGALTLKHEKVASLSKTFGGTLHVYHQQGGGRSEWFLSPNTLRLIADLQLSIECERFDKS